MSAIRFFGVVVAVIAGAKAATAVLAAAGGLPVGQADGSSVFLLVLHVLVQGGAGLFLLVSGRDDPRAFPLGTAFLLTASLFADPLIQGIADARGPQPVGLLDGLLQAQVAAFIPLFVWQFVRIFPGAAPYGPIRRVLGGLERAALAYGVVFSSLHLAQLALVAGGLDAAAATLHGLGRFSDPSLFWLLFWLLLLPAFVVVPWKGARGSSQDARRGRLVLAALIVGMAPVLLFLLAANLSPVADEVLGRPGVLGWWTSLAHLGLLSIPVAIAYAVLVEEALAVRFVVRKAIQHALARYTALALLLGPFAVIAGVLVANRDLPLQRLLIGTSGAILGGSALFGLLLLAARRRVLDAIDRRFFREQFDARRILADLAERSLQVRNVEALVGILEAEIERALHPLRFVFLLRDEGRRALVARRAETRPLRLGSVLARRLAARGSVLRVDLKGAAAGAAGLPEEERHWLLDSGARVLLPFVSSNGPLLGIVALGEKRSELPYSPEDLDLLATIAVSAAATLQRLVPQAAAGSDDHAVAASDDHAESQLVADECSACGAVQLSGMGRCRRCTVQDLQVAEVPLVIGGNYRLLERVGRGGMGIVYRAKDLQLGRDVAIKTLPRSTAREIVRLKKEARHIASLSHPHLAVIYEVESWRGTPLLVLEFLHGGNLREQIDRGPLPVEDVVALGIALSDVLAALHERGILHRDVKPENIGFTAGGHTKLIDLGLARAAGPSDARSESSWAGSLTPTAAGTVVGTVAYLSPEIVRGARPDARQDLWALAVVLYEALTGSHPYQARSFSETILRIVGRELGDIRQLRADVPDGMAELLADALRADPHRRPGSAAQFHRALRLVASEWAGTPARVVAGASPA